MFTISYISAALFCIISLMFGMILSYFLSGRNKIDYKVKYEKGEVELSSSIKKNKKLEKLLSTVTSEKDTWKNKYSDLESDSSHKNSKHHASLVDKDKEIAELQLQIDKANTQTERITKDSEIISERYKKFKEKYDVLAGDQKKINKENSQFSHENQQFKNAVKKLKEQNLKLKQEIEEQQATVQSAKEIQKELRLLRVKNKKFSDDIAYWEKKHYDTHHELAKIKDEYLQTDNKFTELKSYRDGDQIIMENLKKQIEQYKSKFIDVNHKYNELLSSN